MLCRQIAAFLVVEIHVGTAFEKVVPGADDDGYIRAIPLERLCVRLAYGAVDSAVNSGIRQAPELRDFVVDAAIAGNRVMTLRDCSAQVQMMLSAIEPKKGSIVLGSMTPMVRVLSLRNFCAIEFGRQLS